MNIHHSFKPDRMIAQHCSELTERGPRPEERGELLAAWRRDIARELAESLAPLFMGERLSVSWEQSEAKPGLAVFEQIDSSSTNCLLRCGAAGERALLSVGLPTAIALTDRSFGGSGDIPPSETTQELPRSAAILLDRLANVIAQAIANASDGGGGGDMIARSESAARLKPFDSKAVCEVAALSFGSRDAGPWEVTLAIDQKGQDALLPGLGQTVSKSCTSAKPRKPDQAPFRSIPMPLNAILTELDLPLSKLETLAPGDEIPFGLAREVPVRIGSHLVARGTVGTLADRLAIQLTQIGQERPQS
ncbi:MAG: FliM/FliN family flagellar motor switch protein [Pseudomonadota bacterium]